jgi:hypothetical protein
MSSSGMLRRVALVRTDVTPHGVTSQKTQFFNIVLFGNSWLMSWSNTLPLSSGSIVRQARTGPEASSEKNGPCYEHKDWL